MSQDEKINQLLKNGRDDLYNLDCIQCYTFQIVPEILEYEENCTGYVDYTNKVVYIEEDSLEKTIYHEIFHIIIHERYNGNIPTYINSYTINGNEYEEFIKYNGEYYRNYEEFYAEIFSLYERKLFYFSNRYESLYELARVIAETEVN